MTEILYVLAGAAAPVVVQLLASVFQARSEKRRLEQERRLKVIDIYESKRQQAVSAYAVQLGALRAYSQLESDFSINKSLACAAQASSYLPAETRELITCVTNELLEFHSCTLEGSRTSNREHFISSQEFKDNYARLSSLLYSELRRGLFTDPAPQRRTSKTQEP